MTSAIGPALATSAQVFAGAAMTVAIVWTCALPPPARADDLTSTQSVMSGNSPDGLGTWTVRYQRLDGSASDIITEINDQLDAHAHNLVQQATWDGSTRRPWTYDAAGTLQIQPTTASELFTAQYNTAEPHMPIQSVSSIVLDRRSATPITWDNLFIDKTAGLTRLSEATETALVATAPPAHVRDWKRQGQFAPIDINFKAWTPTADGIELHFPEFQYGGGLKTLKVPWSRVADQLRPEFANLAIR